MSGVDEVMAGHVGAGGVPGLAWVVARGDEVHGGAAGTFEVDGGKPVERDTIFRISSMTKPVTAAAALMLVDDGVIKLDDPVDRWLPELAGRRVLRDPEGPLDDTVPAHRPITVHDVLTFRMGIGMDFTASGPQPVLMAAAELGLGAGPPTPAERPGPDEWIRLLGTLPLSHQPGERWLYNTSADVLGVLIGRAAGQSLAAFMQERLFGPLGMHDTGFAVPAAKLDRFGPCYTGDGQVYDPADGQWSERPAFAGGADGLVSTVDDYLAFARMLWTSGGNVLSRSSVEAMTTDQLDADQSGPGPAGVVGWGFGVGVVRSPSEGRAAGAYGWDGGLGSSWTNDPGHDLIGILMTSQMWNAPEPPPVTKDFWAAAYAAIGA